MACPKVNKLIFLRKSSIFFKKRKMTIEPGRKMNCIWPILVKFKMYFSGISFKAQWF